MDSKGHIEKLTAEESSTFFPIKRYAVHLPTGKTDGHGATVVYAATMKYAKKILNRSKLNLSTP